MSRRARVFEHLNIQTYKTYIYKMKKILPKLIVILGPTASGKSGLGIDLARKFRGEIISADSRQIYRGMNIGTAKISKREMREVRHYMIDLVKPSETLTLAEYKDKAIEVINNISRRGKVPFLVGGTGLYISAIVDNWLIPKVKPSKKLRRELEAKSNKWLFSRLKKLDPATAVRIDQKNKRRLVRAVEVCLSAKGSFSELRKKGEPLFETLLIGLDLPRQKLYKRIGERVDEMLEGGLVREVKGLLKKGYGPNLPAMSGIGYKQIGLYLKHKISLEEAVNLIKRDTRRYAKRQMTWFGWDSRIHWVKSGTEAKKHIKKFISD